MFIKTVNIPRELELGSLNVGKKELMKFNNIALSIHEGQEKDGYHMVGKERSTFKTNFKLCSIYYFVQDSLILD